MKSRFYLIDINEDVWEGKPCVRLWGIDEKRRHALVMSSELMPYFYLLPDEDDPESSREKLLQERARFPKLLSIATETKRRLGHESKVLRITCSDTEVLSKYSKEMRKIISKGEVFEEDLRLSVRYITDFMLAPCGWHECDAESVELDAVAVDQTYVAKAVPKTVEEEFVPELSILAFSVLTAAERGSAKAKKDPVRAITITTSFGKTKTLVCDIQDDSKLLRDFAETLTQFNPDVIVGFGSNSVDWPYLIERCRLRKVRLGVGRDGSEPHTSVFGHVSVTGRANLDLFDIAGDIPEIKVKTIENMAKYMQVPSANKATTIEETERYKLWISEGVRRSLIENLKLNVQCLLDLAEATLHFPMQLAAITGLPLDHVMTAAVGFRVDSYLMTQAHQIGELIPHRTEQPFFPYRGAIVLEPETGVHENVAVLDFASMYPRIMRKYNLSPDTFVRPGERVPQDSVFVVPEVKHRFRKEPDGFYRVVLSKLIDERSHVKRELERLGEGTIRHRVLRERERALKIITNACYGYAGWVGARWYVKEVAESAAALGREAITKTIEKAKSLGLVIIYGDTDSIFVDNESKKIENLLTWAKKELDLDIRVERRYIRILFTEAMKRYAGLLPDGSLDIVGLEVVRGDWSDIARQVQEQVLMRILRDQSVEKAVEDVRRTIRRLKSREVPITNLTIRKTLTKPIEQYKVNAPHIEVAKRLLKEGWDLGLGDKVGYVIIKGPGKLFQKATPYMYAKLEDIDIDYYLENQIKPAAMRILERFAVSDKQLAV